MKGVGRGIRRVAGVAGCLLLGGLGVGEASARAHGAVVVRDGTTDAEYAAAADWAQVRAAVPDWAQVRAADLPAAAGDTLPAVSATSKPVLDDPGILRFGILADRTGGMRAGVFRDAAEKMNRMGPEFVLSVGDLIDGYTQDPEVWNAQWEEFEQIVDSLDMRFYYVPGNHDISNAALDSVWRARRGSPWYTFVHKQVLFVVLHTEDRKGGGIGERQAADIRAALQANRDVRRTLVFMHRPLWKYGDQAGYEQVEKALADRAYTVFSGHHHHYAHVRRGGRSHYVLGTSGGGSYLRGVEFGEFDHITWVTVHPDGEEPHVTHLELAGIHGPDIVTEQSEPLVQALRLGGWLTADPMVLEEERVVAAPLSLRFHNSESQPMRVSGTLDPAAGVRVEPARIDTLVPAGSTLHVRTELRAGEEEAEGVSAHALLENGIGVTLKAAYRIDGRTLALETSRPLQMDWPHPLLAGPRKIRTDGALDEWDPQGFTEVTRPVQIQEDWDWAGPEDGRFRWAAVLGEEHLHVAVQAWDQRWVGQSEADSPERVDQFFVQLDARPPARIREERSRNHPYRLYGHEWVEPERFLQIRFKPDGSPAAVQAETATTGSGTPSQDGSGSAPKLQVNDSAAAVRAAGSLERNEAGGVIYTAEVAIPLAYVTSRQGEAWREIRLNVGWMDHDRPENTKPSILWWRPVWDLGADFEGSAVFRRRP